MKVLSLFLGAALIALVFTNPNEADFRNYMQQKHGIAGTLSLKVASIFSAGTSTGVHRDNYVVCSRYYVGGDGILPRTDLAWGVGGKFIDIEEDRKATSRDR